VTFIAVSSAPLQPQPPQPNQIHYYFTTILSSSADTSSNQSKMYGYQTHFSLMDLTFISTKHVFTGQKRLCNTYIQLNSQELTIYNHEIHLKCVQGFGSYPTVNIMTTLQTATGNCCSGKHMSENVP